MNLKELQRNWDEASKLDAISSIFYDPKNKWEKEEFFYSGVKEINEIIKNIESLNIYVNKNKALDFGCGIGRLTQALGNYFDEVIGVDIASNMIKLANEFNLHPEKCKYILNENDNLEMLPDNMFNLIYSNITLQHMESRFIKGYLKEFLRVLSKDGLLIFQLPSEYALTFKGIIKRFTPKHILNAYHKIKYKNKPMIELHGYKKDKVIKLLIDNGAKIIDVRQNDIAGKDWISFQYYVMK